MCLVVSIIHSAVVGVRVDHRNIRKLEPSINHQFKLKLLPRESSSFVSLVFFHEVVHLEFLYAEVT